VVHDDGPAAGDGMPRDDLAALPAASRAFTWSGAMVILVPLRRPDLCAHPVRQIAAVSGTADGCPHRRGRAEGTHKGRRPSWREGRRP
jgi:hypothetical protein